MKETAYASRGKHQSTPTSQGVEITSKKRSRRNVGVGSWHSSGSAVDGEHHKKPGGLSKGPSPYDLENESLILNHVGSHHDKLGSC